MRVISRRSQGRMRKLRKPSITIWPARVPVSVEDCPEQSSATANTTLATPVPSSGASSNVRLLNLRDHDGALEEDGGRDDQDGGVHQQRRVERDRRIDQVEAAGAALGLVALADLPRLHQRRMQVEIVRHHGGAQDPDGDVEALHP